MDQLFKRFQEGEMKAFEMVFQLYRPAIENYALALSEDKDLADALVCETLKNMRKYQRTFCEIVWLDIYVLTATYISYVRMSQRMGQGFKRSEEYAPLYLKAKELLPTSTLRNVG